MSQKRHYTPHFTWGILGADYDFETRLWTVAYRSRITPEGLIRYRILGKVWFPRWVSRVLLKWS